MQRCMVWVSTSTVLRTSWAWSCQQTVCASLPGMPWTGSAAVPSHAHTSACTAPGSSRGLLLGLPCASTLPLAFCPASCPD